MHDISLDVAEGEITTVIGPDGAGKSTLLRTITGFEHPTAGSIRFDGKDIGTISARKNSATWIDYRAGGRSSIR